MKTLFILSVVLLPILAYSQKPMSNYTTSNAGDKINTEYDEWFAMIMPDGLSLYFSSNRTGGYGDLDIYVSTRKSKSDNWSEPQNLGPNINTSSVEHSVTVSNDGHWVIFTSEKEGGVGTGDFYISYREDTSDPLAWEKAKNAGKNVNSIAYEGCAFYHKIEDGSNVYFSSNRTGGIGQGDIYVSTMKNGDFTIPIPVQAINSPEEDMHFEPIDGLIWTNRKGGLGGHDIWITTKRNDKSGWQTPVALGSNINSPYNEGLPSMIHDKSLFVFHSDRLGGKGKYDIYFGKPTK